MIKKIILISAINILLLCACSQNTDNEHVIQVGSFNYALGAYKIKFRNHNYLMLVNENDFYYLLDAMGVVKGKIDYFNKRKRILESPVELDSTRFFNWKYDIIFVDSCNKVLVNKWIQKIKNDPNNLHKPIKVDSTVSRINLNNIYYGLIQDSFKLYERDSDGSYILSH